MFAARHPHDNRLFDCYMMSRQGERADPRLAEHLADCAACATRYTELAAFMDGIANDAAAESDEHFTPERLRTQQQHILRRIEHAGRPARVISFPRHGAPERMHPPSAHAPSKWIAGAAAAGLFVGVAMGALLGLRQTRGGNLATKVVATATAPAPASTASQVAATENSDATASESKTPDVSDAAFLNELDSMLERTQTRELVAIDAFTPHVRGVRQVSQVRYVR